MWREIDGLVIDDIRYALNEYDNVQIAEDDESYHVDMANIMNQFLELFGDDSNE